MSDDITLENPLSLMLIVVTVLRLVPENMKCSCEVLQSC